MSSDKKRLSPAAKENNIPIVFSCNVYFAPYTAVMIQSIIDHASPENHYDIIILHTEFKSEHITRLEKMADKLDNCTIRFFDVSEICKGYSFFVKRDEHKLSKETYYRMMIWDILSEEYEKAIYLDGDMVTLTDVAQLYNVDLSGFYMAAVPDICGIAECYKPDGRKRANYLRGRLKLSDLCSYFIGGLLVLNLPELRRDYPVKKILDLAASHKWRQHDQDVLNFICGDKKAKLLHASWNVLQNYGNNHLLPERLLKQWHESEQSPLIIHYGGSSKPWEKTVPRQEYFWKTAAKTEYFETIVQRMNMKRTEYGKPFQPYTADEIESVRKEVIKGDILPRSSSIMTVLDGFEKIAYVEMEYKPLISVIVPVYNVEPYLRDALDSLLGQTYKNLEIILVDDGSPDNCGAICDEYSAKDSRIKVIHKENGGVASARNAGLAAATGEWIGWLDSDDWIDPDMFEYMASCIQDGQADIVVCGRIEEDENGWQVVKHIDNGCLVLEAEQALKLLMEDEAMRSYLWDKLWRRELFDGIKFPKLTILEDFACMHYIFAKAGKVVCLPEGKYHYYQRESSLVNDWNIQKQANYICIQSRRFQYVLENWPQLIPAMSKKVLRSLQYLWKICRHASGKELKECKSLMDEVTAFSRKYYSMGLRYADVGRCGRLQIWLTRFPYRWSFFMYALLDKLYWLRY